MPNCRLSKEKRKKIWGAMQLALLVVEESTSEKSRRAKCSPTQRNETTGTKQEQELLQRAKFSCLLGGKIGQ
jgi:hypothetical protein